MLNPSDFRPYNQGIITYKKKTIADRFHDDFTDVIHVVIGPMKCGANWNRDHINLVTGDDFLHIETVILSFPSLMAMNDFVEDAGGGNFWIRSLQEDWHGV